MKVAISSTGEGIESQVDARFGRCPYFVVVEIENKKIKKIKTIKNTAAAQFGGAGITAAQVVANEKVNAIITMNLGPRAFGVLQQLSIEMYQGSGKIKAVIKQLIDGKLKKISSSTGPMFMGAGADKGRGKKF
ncbi:MAG: NifB/NifX family molybdenum-iron cluster-binding protein [Candidatus Pacearchaeota archaeon]|nr:MAG: NifB/NifX family molybdenum-iron cluster-binding protein [Candidatus Pacearchaeota archaeon]